VTSLDFAIERRFAPFWIGGGKVMFLIAAARLESGPWPIDTIGSAIGTGSSSARPEATEEDNEQPNLRYVKCHVQYREFVRRTGPFEINRIGIPNKTNHFDHYLHFRG
jgi:hypothetical protein